MGFFTPYLHSAVKPDPIFSTIKNYLERDDAAWLSWYNHSSIQNGTILSSSSLSRKAAAFKNRIFGSSETVLHYICTADYNHNGIHLKLYRLTYQVSSPFGFVDLEVAV